MTPRTMIMTIGGLIGTPMSYGDVAERVDNAGIEDVVEVPIIVRPRVESEGLQEVECTFMRSAIAYYYPNYEA